MTLPNMMPTSGTITTSLKVMRWMNHTKIHVPSVAVAKANSARPQSVEFGMNNSASKMPNCAEEMVAPVVGGDELVHAKLLHDEPRHAHANAGAEDGEQARQPRDDEYLQLLHIPAKQRRQIQVDDADEQRTDAGRDQADAQNDGDAMALDGRSPPFLMRPLAAADNLIGARGTCISQD